MKFLTEHEDNELRHDEAHEEDESKGSATIKNELRTEERALVSNASEDKEEERNGMRGEREQSFARLVNCIAFFIENKMKINHSEKTECKEEKRRLRKWASAECNEHEKECDEIVWDLAWRRRCLKPFMRDGELNKTLMRVNLSTKE